MDIVKSIQLVPVQIFAFFAATLLPCLLINTTGVKHPYSLHATSTLHLLFEIAHLRAHYNRAENIPGPGELVLFRH